MNKETQAAKAVASSLIGLDVKRVIVGSKSYTIPAPTIRRIAGAINHLSDIDISDKPTLRELLMSCAKAESYAKALSWLVQGDDALWEELADNKIEEIVDALCEGFDMTGQSFMKAASLLKFVKRLAAKNQ